MIVFRWRISDFFIFALQAFLAWLGPAWLWESSREPQKAIGHDPGIPKNSPTSQHVYCIIVSEIKQSLAPTARKRWYFPAIFVNTKVFLWSSCIIFYDSWVCNFFFLFSPSRLTKFFSVVVINFALRRMCHVKQAGVIKSTYRMLCFKISLPLPRCIIMATCAYKTYPQHSHRKWIPRS